MRIWNRTTAALIAAIVVLSAACGLAHRARRAESPELTLTADPARLISQRLDALYRDSARAAAPGYDVNVLVGSGAGGARDGFGLYAQLLDPVDISLSPDASRLLVLDAGAGSLREVLVEARQLATVAAFSSVQAGKSVYVRVAAAPGGAFLVDSNKQGLVFLGRSGEQRALMPMPDGPAAVSDLVFDAGRLLVLDGTTGRLLEIVPGEWKWKRRAAVPVTGLDRFCVDGNAFVVASSAGGRWFRFALDGTALGVNPGAGPVEQILCDRGLKRYVALSAGKLLAVPSETFTASPVALEVSNIEGRRLGNAKAPYGYHTTWLSGATRITLDAQRNAFYVVDRNEKRVLQALNSFVSWKYGPLAGNSRGFYSPEYAPIKPAGTTRILWLSHSVFWSPAGVEDGNLAMGAPRMFEHVLNEHWPQAGRWEVLNPGLTGIEFFTTAFPRTAMALQTYGLDHAVVVMDLQNLQWLFQFNGVRVPAAFDKSGAPSGIDAGLAAEPVLQRQYPKQLAPLMDYIRTNMVGVRSRMPLLNEQGDLEGGRFLPAWLQDATFRGLLLEVYLSLLRGLRQLTAEAGVQLTVLVSPTTNFVSQRDWVDAYGMGTNGAIDFEAAHRPILEALWRAGIPAYDLTYDMLGRHPQLFPFNASSHHKSNLFHRAVAESAQAVVERFGVFDLRAQQARAPRSSPAAAAAPAGQAIITERGGVCYVLHDLWQGGRARAEAPGFAELLSIGVADVGAAVARAEYACQAYRITFANVKNRDDYGNRDFRDFEQLATMTITSDQLAMLARAVETRADTPELHTAVQFRRGRR